MAKQADRSQASYDAMNSEMGNLWQQGLETDVTAMMEKKGKFTYLSWVYAMASLKGIYPMARVGEVDFKRKLKIGVDGQGGDLFEEVEVPYLQTEQGFFVRAWIEKLPGMGIITHTFPILDYTKKKEAPQPMKDPSCFDINTAIMRAKTKLIAIETGIGFHIYAGEDIPDDFAGGIKADSEATLVFEELLKHPAVNIELPHLGGATMAEHYAKIVSDDNHGRASVREATAAMKSIVSNATQFNSAVKAKDGLDRADVQAVEERLHESEPGAELTDPTVDS